MITTETVYSVYERFWTIQGEGVHTGRRMYLVRLVGCDQQCPWCDAAGTWHPNWMPGNVERLPAEAIAEEVGTGDIVLITGGEPTLYNLRPLVEEVHARGAKVHLETAGHHEAPDGVDWITLSPKFNFKGAKPPKPRMLQRANELKLIVTSPRDLGAQLDEVENWQKLLREDAVVWLHPEWGSRHDPELLENIVATVLHDVARYVLDIRAGWQTHKLYMADPNPQKVVVPLGGNPEKGSPV